MKRFIHLLAVIILIFTFIAGCNNLGADNTPIPSQLPDGIKMHGKILVDGNEPEFIKKNGLNVVGADPHILVDDEYYYMYGTGYSIADDAYVPTFRSADGKNWEEIPTAIAPKPYVFTGNETYDRANHRLFKYWGPDVYKLGDKYYMFLTGPVTAEDPMDYLTSQLYISVYVSESDSPEGPFEKFLKILPRVPQGSTRNQINAIAPHSVILDDPQEVKNLPNNNYYGPLRVDFHLFEDPNDNELYVTYTAYSNTTSKDDQGNNIMIFKLKNYDFDDTSDKPAFYYDFEEEYYIHASNPVDWPELIGVVPTTLDQNNKVWRPKGYPFLGYARGVTEAPNLIYKDGWYQLYFSCNTWDSPSYQIVTVFVKDLKDFDVQTRKTLTSDRLKIGRFQMNKGSPETTWLNYGSGCVFKDRDGSFVYAMHITYPSLKREIMFKKIVW